MRVVEDNNVDEYVDQAGPLKVYKAKRKNDESMVRYVQCDGMYYPVAMKGVKSGSMQWGILSELCFNKKDFGFMQFDQDATNMLNVARDDGNLFVIYEGEGDA